MDSQNAPTLTRLPLEILQYLACEAATFGDCDPKDFYSFISSCKTTSSIQPPKVYLKEVFEHACKTGNLLRVRRLLNREGVGRMLESSLKSDLLDSLRHKRMGLVSRLAKKLMHHPGVQDDLNLNTASKNIHQRLIEAAKNQDDPQAQMLLNHLKTQSDGWFGARLLSRSDAFALAAIHGQIHMMHFLLDDPRCDACIQYEDVMLFAAAYQHQTIVLRLLDDPRVGSPRAYKTAMIQACKQGPCSLIRLLLNDHRFHPSVCENEHLITAITHHQLEHVRMLLKDPRTNPTHGTLDVFLHACSIGDIPIIKILLQDPRIDPGTEYNRALMNASRQRNKSLVLLLLSDQRVDPSIENNKLLHSLMGEDFADMVTILMQDARVQAVEDRLRSVMEPVRSAILLQRSPGDGVLQGFQDNTV